MKYKGGWNELTVPTTASGQTTTKHNRTTLTMSDVFDPTRSQDHYRTELNNFLQVNGGTRRLQWQTSHQGLHHKLVWTAVCYIDEIECSRASSNTLGVAKEIAAHMAHRALVFQNFRQCAGMVA